MATQYGLTTSGFRPKRLEDVRSGIEQALKAELGDVATGPDSVLGTVISPFAKQLADLWELGEVVYGSQYPSTAEGTSLDHVASITGIRRLAAKRSSTTLQCFGDEGTSLASGRVVSVASTEARFETTTALTISQEDADRLDISVDTVADSTTYTVTINGTGFSYTSGSGATAASIASGLVTEINNGSEPVTATDNGDGTFYVEHDDLTLAFDGAVGSNLAIDQVASPVEAVSQEYGPIPAPADTLTEIETPVAGWGSVTNPYDAEEGRNRESDADLRARREEALKVAGAGTVEAIRSSIAAVSGVSGVLVLENEDDTTDNASGRPPKSFEVVVGGGADQDIADTIWEVKPAGIQAYGNTVLTVTDSQGYDQEVAFSRATERYLHVRVTYAKYAEEDFPDNGESAIAENVLEYGQGLGVGDDVLVDRFIPPVLQVAGIASVTVEIAETDNPEDNPASWQTTNLAVSDTETAVFDSGRITVQEA